MRNPHKIIVYSGAALLSAVLLLTLATYLSFRPPAPDFNHLASDSYRLQILDRNGTPLSTTYRNEWNLHDALPLHAIPELLQQAFILSEDRHFREHRGVDWPGRFSAASLNLRHRHSLRGASTITEQVVRMLHPRPRNLWSRWVEGFEAASLERHANKADILEFYLNQVPYAHNWRGVAQAAHGYFHRDPDTLNPKEMLTLAVLVRAPSALDPRRDAEKARLERSVAQLAERMHSLGVLDDTTYAAWPKEPLSLETPALPLEASHFVQYVRQHSQSGDVQAKLRTTLDSHLQQVVQSLLDQRLKALHPQHVGNAAALVVDHTTGEVLAWVVAGQGDAATPGREIDAVTIPRQPGSAMKPFLYAAALDKGWNASTLLDDSPLEDAVGHGLHRFRNYSRSYHGWVPLREALANSLNIPAVRAINYVGVRPYLSTLHRLGFTSLQEQADIYDEGLALGNGAVTLYELVQGYAALAGQGRFRPLKTVLGEGSPHATAVYSPEAASLVGDILSDRYARQWEFGENSVLNLPVQTAAKTGTSTDYRDAWAVGFNDCYVVGLWMGNLDNQPMDGVTGSIGPSLTLRSIFNELNKDRDTAPLTLSPKLVRQATCVPMHGKLDGPCASRPEWFLPGRHPEDVPVQQASGEAAITRPTDGLQLAYDPRIPPDHQAFQWKIEGTKAGDEIEWVLNDTPVTRGRATTYLWPLQRGSYDLSAFIWQPDGKVRKVSAKNFVVK